MAWGGSSATRQGDGRVPERDRGLPRYKVRWISMSGTYVARGHRGVAWQSPVGKLPPWRLQPGGSKTVYLCERHHIALGDERMYWKAKAAP